MHICFAIVATTFVANVSSSCYITRTHKLPKFMAHIKYKRIKWMKWLALINPVTRDAPRIRLHLSIVEALNAYVPYTMTCGGHRMNQVSASSFQTSLTNLPTPEGWMAWLATGGIESSIVCVRNEPLTTAPHAPNA
ncbi:hypothetical protein Y032_0042g702 [Ancylostoma ceylanicum]|uniref:Secreted protein n=1 Tax=Ancylostoma ceylanicum TaxID=53326 RepID=A0A016UGQ9_9BILA|nr:hypothetical protein Y032_0042g702 [Ancylostoma ceylanicum]